MTYKRSEQGSAEANDIDRVADVLSGPLGNPRGLPV
jgi:hypothetical protein